MISGAEDGLERILNSPESMAKIAEIARSLRGGSPAEPLQTTEMSSESNGIAQAFSGLNLDPSMMRTIATAVQGYTASDRRTRLLEAVRPFASAENARLVDRALQAVRLARSVGTVLRDREGGSRFV